jgi:CRISPR-associated protein Csb2
MLAIGVELLFGRYHATAWGRAANEGDVEWPPSPWRLGRALVDSWYRLPGDDRPDEVVIDRLLGALASAPRFVLPQGSVGHTRHYMPEADGGSTSSPVLDSFVQVDPARFTMLWDGVDLTAGDRSDLQRLLDGLGYLGRAESACVAGIVDNPPAGGLGSQPFTEQQDPGRDDVVNVLCLDESASLESLSESTARRRGRRLDSAPSGRWVAYTRPAGALEPRRARPTPPAAPVIELMRFALEGPARPPITEALRVAEIMRAASLRRVNDDDAISVERLRGRSVTTDAPLEGHQHCHYLVTDEDGDGRVDHISVWCPAGLTRAARGALDVERLSSNWRLEHPVYVVLVEARTAGDLPTSGPTAEARIWASHTPFVAVRHPKRRGGELVDGIADQVRTELLRRGFPKPVAVDAVRPARRAWGSFRRERDNAGRSGGQRSASGWCLEFAEPVRGPIALGRHSHFGMGLFMPHGRE